MRHIAIVLAAVACVVLATLLVIDVAVRVALLGHLYADAASAPSAPVTIVLGAEVYADGRLSPALQSRLDVAIALLEHGKTNLLVMSGGNGMFEVDAMRAYLVAHDVAEEVVLPDPGGERTRASCGHGRHTYRELPYLLVSQGDYVAHRNLKCRAPRGP